MELTDRAGAVEPKRAISRGMVSLYKKYVGRGPTDARTYLSDDLVVVVLRDTMTTAEKTLAESGKQELVLECRRGFQQTMRDEGVALVEREVGGKVVAVMNDNSLDPDYAVEVFVVVGRGGSGAGVNINGDSPGVDAP